MQVDPFLVLVPWYVSANYVYGSANPVKIVDPFGLQDIKGNDFGDWVIEQQDFGADPNRPVNDYQSNTRITFKPKCYVYCDEIVFLQALRINTAGTAQTRNPFPDRRARLTRGGWALDRADQHKYGWYGLKNDGTWIGNITPGSAPNPSKNAIIADTPSWNAPNVRWQFITCAVCRKGTDSNKMYGCLYWGFVVDNANQLTSISPNFLPYPGGHFFDTIEKWNEQASGAVANRAAPDQQPLPKIEVKEHPLTKPQIIGPTGPWWMFR